MIVQAIYKFAVPTNYKSTFDYIWYLMQHFYNKQKECVDETWCENHVKTLEIRSTGFNGKIRGRMQYDYGVHPMFLFIYGQPNSRELELQSYIDIANLFPEDLKVTEYALNVSLLNSTALWEALQNYVTKQLGFIPQRMSLFGCYKYHKYYRKDPDIQLRLSFNSDIRIVSNKPVFEDFNQFQNRRF